MWSINSGAGARVISTSFSDAKLERLKELGADELINYRSEPEWGRSVRQFTHGRGGGPRHRGRRSVDSASVHAGEPRGRAHSDDWGLERCWSRLPLALALARQLRMQAFLVGSRRQQQDMVRAIEANGLRPVIDRHFPLEQIVGAFRLQESGRHFGKIALDP